MGTLVLWRSGTLVKEEVFGNSKPKTDNWDLILNNAKIITKIPATWEKYAEVFLFLEVATLEYPINNKGIKVPRANTPIIKAAFRGDPEARARD